MKGSVHIADDSISADMPSLSASRRRWVLTQEAFDVMKQMVETRRRNA